MEDKLILLVEDNPHIMAINDAALHMRGYRTCRRETAHKCRELLCFHAVDLIVLDILLPDGDGVALCREIKQEYDVPILFLTAMGENEDIVKGLTAGGDDYLTKPYDWRCSWPAWKRVCVRRTRRNAQYGLARCR